MLRSISILAKSLAFGSLAFALASAAPEAGAAANAASPATPPRAESYRWRNVALGGGGFVTGLVFHPSARDVVYARTDVGGAYRWNADARVWEPLLDWLGRPEWNLQGVESLAVDPADPDRLYLAVGTYTHPDASVGEILRSTDRGRSWARTALPFRLGANEAGRNSGERLAVDPHAGHILLFGTRRDGLWRSEDHGATWARVLSFPDLPDDSIDHPPTPGRYHELSQAVGLVRVAFDPTPGRAGEPTPVIYAALSRAAGGLFRSLDAGQSWELIAGQPTGLRPTGLAVAGDRTVFVTYGDRPGTNEMYAGAVWRFTPTTGAWTNVTPQEPAPATAKEGRFGYAAVCVDPGDPHTVLVSTWNRWTGDDEIFRSTDGGATWRPTLHPATWDDSSAPYIRTLTPHWISDVEIDPFDRQHVLFTTGYGLWATHQADAADHGKPTPWVFTSPGLEETVPQVLVSPTAGAPLVSGVADVDGFRHDDLGVSPPARFAGPRFKSTLWLDYAAARPARFVRAGVTYEMDRIHGAWSDDGAATWQAFPTEPAPPAGGRAFGTGPIAISADGTCIVWTTRGNAPYVTRDRGATWTRCEGAPLDLLPVADRNAPSRFYGYDLRHGALYLSEDGGRSFTRRAEGLPKFAGPAGRGAKPLELRSVAGHPGDLWLCAQEQLYRSTDDGATWHLFHELAAVSSVGLGRPAPGADYPAVYIAAAIGQEDGLFRSDDAGASWIRISDHRHRFGSARALTGDPRVFGRVYFATGGRGIVYGEPVD